METVTKTLEELPMLEERAKKSKQLPKLFIKTSRPILDKTSQQTIPVYSDILLKTHRASAQTESSLTPTSVLFRPKRSDKLRSTVRAASSLNSEISHYEVSSTTRIIPFGEFGCKDSFAISDGVKTTVNRYSWKSTEVVVKFLKETSTDESERSFRNELVLMQSLRHPKIISLIAVTFDSCGPQRCTLGLVMEFMENGSLYDYMRKVATKEKKSFTNIQKLKIIADISSALMFIHDSGFVLCNASSNNILLDSELHAKVSGLGHCNDTDKTKYDSHQYNSMAPWIAPEVLMGAEMTSAADVYSVGVVLWELLTGQIPWDGLSLPEITLKVGKNDERLELPIVSPVFPESILHLMNRCFSCSEKRPDFNEFHSIVSETVRWEEKRIYDTPESFLCPITLCIMFDPVVASDGHSYERCAIQEWLTRTDRSPKTNIALKRKTLIPNHALRSLIEDYQNDSFI